MCFLQYNAGQKPYFEFQHHFVSFLEVNDYFDVNIRFNPLLSFSGDFEQFFGFFSELVSPIELILFSLA